MVEIFKVYFIPSYKLSYTGLFTTTSNTYRKELSWLHFDNEPKVQERQQVKDQNSYVSFFVAYPIIPSSN